MTEQRNSVAETKEFRRPFSRSRDNIDELRRVEATIHPRFKQGFLSSHFLFFKV